MRGLLACVLAALAAWPAEGQDKPADAVRGVLKEQVQAWNKGDLDRFMVTYWDSDELTFYSGGTVTKGRKAVAERYRKTYRAEGKEMGKLAFSEMDVQELGPETALARARWKLVTSKETFEGLFTLILRKFPDGWKIVHDHTSKADPPKK
jgi:beta-aspartyl-peptidase (threonine type)